MSDQPDATTAGEFPRFRYGAALANEIEARWQDRWEAEGTFRAPNPKGPLSDGFDPTRPKLFVMDMFPYPSGDGLHVGHPLGYLGTDVYARFKRMAGYNVLHTLGYDAFGLPAEQYAIQTGQHPRVTTERNIESIRGQLRGLGMGHDERRSVSTIDPRYYRWTQWIFLQIFGSWYDVEAGRARPIEDLVAELDAGTQVVRTEEHPDGAPWATLDDLARRRLVDSQRLVYLDEAPVNWCPGLGTVLANEEVTPDGRSERGNFPVYKRPLRQWKMRITAYSERLLADLDLIDWPERVKTLQRNWIGRSEGARIHFRAGPDLAVGIDVFTTRPDTLFGATYMVLAPEHPLVDELTGDRWPEGVPASWRGAGIAAAGEEGWATPGDAVAGYRRYAGSRSDVERQVETRTKTGVFTGASAVNPATGKRIPVFIADYVLMGYGTGAIMAVPAHDHRDFEFARTFGLPIVPVVAPSEGWLTEHDLDEGDAGDASRWTEAWTGSGLAIASANEGVALDGLGTDDAKAGITTWLEQVGAGEGTTSWKLRDWLFSRQRYWGEPFPIVFDEHDLPVAVPESELPVLLPEIDDYAPIVKGDGDETVPEPPLGRAEAWREVELDLGDGPRTYRRELNTMPNWAGSCWYYLRYLDPTNEDALVDPEVERYWMQGANPDGTPAFGGVDLYVGGVEHAVLHLLYARFWHKVLFDLGHVSTPEPFRRLYNQGYILAAAYTDERGVYVPAVEVVPDEAGGFTYQGRPVRPEAGKMGKSLKNSVSPQEVCSQYGADTLRLYEMAMGPLDADRPWNARDIVGVHRLLQRLWRNVVEEETGELRVDDAPAGDGLRRTLHRTIAGVAADYDALRFNTAVAKLTELNNVLTKEVGATGRTPREVAEPLVLLLAPLAPHIAEELWSRLGHTDTVVWQPFPEADPDLLVAETVEIPVQVGGKVRARIQIPADADPAAVEALALADDKVVAALGDTPVQRVVVVPGRLVNIVT
ncbi:MAG: class I tRNA ligase family protein [Acidimicrobiales bacterium]